MKIKNEAELLNRFCDKTHIKEILTEPFSTRTTMRFGVLMELSLFG